MQKHIVQVIILMTISYYSITCPFGNKASVFKDKNGHTVGIINDIHSDSAEETIEGTEEFKFTERTKKHFSSVLSQHNKMAFYVEAPCEAITYNKNESFDGLPLFKKLTLLSLPLSDQHFIHTASYFGCTFSHSPVEISDLRENTAGKLVNTLLFTAPEAFEQTKQHILRQVKHKEKIIDKEINRLRSIRKNINRINIAKKIFQQKQILWDIRRYKRVISQFDSDVDETVINTLLFDSKLRQFYVRNNIIKEYNNPRELSRYFNKKLHVKAKERGDDITIGDVITTAQHHAQEAKIHAQNATNIKEKALWEHYGQKFETVYQKQLQLQSTASTQSWLQASLKAGSADMDYMPSFSTHEEKSNIGKIWSDELPEYGFMLKIIENRKAHKPVLMYVGSDHADTLKDHLISLGYAKLIDAHREKDLCLSEEAFNKFFATLQKNL